MARYVLVLNQNLNRGVKRNECQLKAKCNTKVNRSFEINHRKSRQVLNFDFFNANVMLSNSFLSRLCSFDPTIVWGDNGSEGGDWVKTLSQNPI